MYMRNILASSYPLFGNAPPTPGFDTLLSPGVYKMTFAWEIALGIKQFWKVILRSINNCWETNLSKIIQKILVLDLSIMVLIKFKSELRRLVKEINKKHKAIKFYFKSSKKV